nr:hypothetical protein [Tanacetum cinerariifolium]
SETSGQLLRPQEDGWIIVGGQRKEFLDSKVALAQAI